MVATIPDPVAARLAGLASVSIQICAASLAGLAVAGPVGLALGLLFGAIVGGTFGWAVASGCVYPPSRRGVGLFLVDHTWSLGNTISGAIYLTGHLIVGHRLDREATVHSGRVNVVERVHRHYAMTIGTVVAGANPRLLPHEDWHVFQARLLGPIYLPLVAFNYALFSLVPVWLLYHDHRQWPINGPVTYFSCGVYPHVWHEAWAYRRDRRCDPVDR